nr:PREDICTED: polyadenylate-binding protein 4-like [Apteryx mantelli mantelli]
MPLESSGSGRAERTGNEGDRLAFLELLAMGPRGWRSRFPVAAGPHGWRSRFPVAADATVYVGGLDEKVSEPLLWELFLQAGPVVNTHMPKDRVTGQHQGYGFVEFLSEEDADYAIKIMNMIKLYGKPIRVNKASAHNKNLDVGANIFIGNLDPEIDEKLLYDTFSAFGVILQTPKIMRDPDTGNSKGYAFINFASFDASDAAIEAMNGQYLCNRPITVSYAFKKDSKGERHGSAAERLLAAQNPLSQAFRFPSVQDATVYVGGLDEKVSEPLLWELFLQAGPVVNTHMPKDRVTGQHQGYGFVEFLSEEDADYAIKIMNMIKLYGKPIRVNKASAHNKNLDVGANIFIGNLDPEIDEKLLYDTFSAFGVILQTPKIMRDPDTGNSKGYAFINFASFDASDAAIEAMNGQYLCNRPITVSYAFKKDSKGERHGSAAERLLAAQNPLSQADRPHQLFADAPPPPSVPTPVVTSLGPGVTPPGG